MIELQSRILSLNLVDLKDFGIKMKWLNVETTEGKGKFELIKIVRNALEEEASECEGDGFSNLVAKIKLLLQENKSDKSNESLEETNKKKQELLELETQYEQLSRAQEELKQKMQLLELAQKQSNLLNERENEPTTSTETGLSNLNASIFRREFKIQGQISEPGQKDKLTYQSLISQIESGLKKGYTESEVVTAVIRSIQAGLQLRSYLEGLTGLSFPNYEKSSVSTFRRRALQNYTSSLLILVKCPRKIHNHSLFVL